MVNVYLMKIDQLYCENVFEEKLKQIDSMRRQKVEQCKNKDDKCRSLGCGLLLQYALKEKMEAEGTKEVEILELTYGDGLNGKPYLKGFPKFFFNLSHSGDYVVLAVSDGEVGVDIQEMKPLKSNIAKRFFTPEEVEMLESIKCEEKRNLTFFKIWTAKESYIKLTGKGLSQGLDTFFVDLDEFMIWDKLEKRKSGYLKEFLLGEVQNKRQGNSGYIMMVCSQNEELGEMKMVELLSAQSGVPTPMLG